MSAKFVQIKSATAYFKYLYDCLRLSIYILKQT